MQAVEIHSIESNRRAFRLDAFVKIAQPLDEFDDDRVAPHPRGEPAKPRKRFICVSVHCSAAHVTMYSRRIRPVCLNGQNREVLFGDQPSSDRSALRIKFVRAVSRFAQQNKSRITDQLQQLAEIVCIARKWLSDFSNKFGVHHC